jgi:RHS repeat-associated protein
VGTITINDQNGQLCSGNFQPNQSAVSCNVTLPVGTYTITATYSGESGYQGSNYAGSTSSPITVTVLALITPSITWSTPAAIIYGTALSATQLNASANVPGTFVYSPAAGTVLSAGSQTLSTTFTPTNTAEYSAATASVTLTVGDATPAITWVRPAAITYGTALSATQLNATANVPGTFSYSPAAGAVLGLGTQTLSTTFTPNGATGGDYTTLTASVPLTVVKAATTNTTATITVNGAEQTGDANAITIKFNGFVETVLYGQFSTPASVASAFAAMFSRDYVRAGLCANASGATITFQLKGAQTFGALDIEGPTTSFSFTSSGFLSVAQQTAADTGTVTLSINGGVIATTSYGDGSTPSSVAQRLASAASSSQVTVTAVDDTVYIQAITPGAASNSISYSVQNAGFNTSGTTFAQPSFPASTLSGNLQGGATAGAGAAVTVYSYTGVVYDGASNLKSYTDSSNNLPIMGTWSFTYDTLNRVATASAGSNAPAPYANNTGCWNYDQFGNRTSQAMSTTACGSNPPLMSWANYNANNQFTETNRAPGGVGYDSSGDVTNDGLNTYVYDGEGRICAVASTPVPGMTTYTGYLYDAEGTRVAKGSITSLSCDPAVNGFQTINDYVLGPGGEQATEMGMDPVQGMVWQHTNVWAAGKLLGTYDKDGLHFYLDDPLGTRRVQTDFAGVVERTCVSLPFGDGETCQPTPTEHLFTGKERDSESGNDYFGARYYASTMGRFMSPDWSAKVAPVPYAKLDNPQSLNLYAYVLNNPLIHVDADGHIIDDSALKDNKKYQTWKTNYLSHDGAKAQWNALNDNKSLTVHMGWDSKGTSSTTGDFKFSAAGNLTEATVTLAAKTGDSNYHMSAEAGYVHGSTITDSKLQEAYVVAHELGHVEQAFVLGGKEMVDQRAADGAFTQQKYAEMGIQPALRDPPVAAANQRLMDTSHQLETGADQRAWDIVGPK